MVSRSLQLAPLTPLVLRCLAAPPLQALIPYYTGKIVDYASIDPSPHDFKVTTLKMLGVALGCAVFTGIRGGLFTVRGEAPAAGASACLGRVHAEKFAGSGKLPLRAAAAPQVAMTRLNVRIRQRLFHSLMQQARGLADPPAGPWLFLLVRACALAVLLPEAMV